MLIYTILRQYRKLSRFVHNAILHSQLPYPQQPGKPPPDHCLLVIAVILWVWPNNDKDSVPLAIGAQQSVPIGFSSQALEIRHRAHRLAADLDYDFRP
jgi:hypothetical protein